MVKYGIAQHASSSPFACEIITADTAAACPQHIGAQRQAALTRASDKRLSDKRAAQEDRAGPCMASASTPQPTVPALSTFT